MTHLDPIYGRKSVNSSDTVKILRLHLTNDRSSYLSYDETWCYVDLRYMIVVLSLHPRFEIIVSINIIINKIVQGIPIRALLNKISETMRDRVFGFLNIRCLIMSLKMPLTEYYSSFGFKDTKHF